MEPDLPMKIEEYFIQGKDWSDEERLEWAEKLLEEASETYLVMQKTMMCLRNAAPF